MGEINVKFGSLSGGAEGIAASYKSLVSTLEDMEHQLAPMVSTWTGDAQQAYFQQKQKWDQAAASMATILSQMGQAVSNAHDGYKAGENSNISLWS